MTLFDDDKPKPKRKPHPRDETWHELFKLAEATFYESGISEDQRAQVARLIDNLRQKGATAGNFKARKVRYREVYPNSACTLPAMLNQWDTCAPVSRTQPGMPSDAEQAARRRENEAHRRGIENEQRERDRARQIVLAAPAGVAEKLYQEWRGLPENALLLKFGGRSWTSGPTGRFCVRWIAERIEATKGGG